MKIFRWIAGTLGVLLILGALSRYGDTMFARWFYLFMASSLFAIYRLLRGPDNLDRWLAFKAASVVLTGFCAILAVSLDDALYIDIAIAWILQTYLLTVVFTKLFSGRKLDD